MFSIEVLEQHIVPELKESIRIQEYGVGIFAFCPTKSSLKKALKKKLVLINNLVASTASMISGGETIVLLNPPNPKKHTTQKLKFTAIYEDEHLAVINKPAGILVSGNRHKTITNHLSYNLKQSSLLDKCKAQPCHRLDFGTTGALLIGKTQSAIRELNNMFTNKSIDKAYLAITIGEMKPQGLINIAINEKEAHTAYNVLATVPSERFDYLNLVYLKPKTGRKHQIRIHLSSLGNPILGDKSYGIPGLVLNGKGIYLHAFKLNFEHPFSKQEIKIKAELPRGFEKIFPNYQSKIL